MNLTNEFEPVRQWAINRSLYKQGDVKTQFVKLLEEVGELSSAILKNNDAETIDAVGDCVIVLTNLAALKGYNIEDCINAAFSVIAKRKGKMENGTFVKEK